MNQTEEKEIISCHLFGISDILIKEFPSPALYANQVVIVIANSMLIIPSIVMNVLSIATILKSSQLYSKPCYFIILVQSTADLAVGVLGTPLFLVYLSAGMADISNCYVGILTYRLSLIPIAESSFILLGMTFDRYVAVLQPFAYSSKVTKKKILIYACLAASGIGFTIIVSLAMDKLLEFLLVVSATLMLIFISFAYTRIYLVVRRLNHSRNKIHKNENDGNVTRGKVFFQEIKQARSCFLVVVCHFFLCFLPIMTGVSFIFDVNKIEHQVIQNWVVTLSILNCTLNSAIFFWTKQMLRREARKMLNSFLW